MPFSKQERVGYTTWHAISDPYEKFLKTFKGVKFCLAKKERKSLVKGNETVTLPLK